MRRASAILTIALGVAAIAHAESRWIRMESDTFELYASAGERSSRSTLRHFEEVRQVFLKALGRSESRGGKVRLVAFKSMKEFEPYRPGQYASAYYLYGNGKDLIVLSGTGADVEQTAVHEYIHLLVRQAGLKLPPWLNEGIAELYSTMKPQGNGVLVGIPIASRLIHIQTSKRVPLAQILAADQAALSDATKDSAGSLYSMGWALTHMLAMNEDYRSGFSDLMKLILDGTDSRRALETVYRKPLQAVERDLQLYVREQSFKGVILPVKLERNKDELPETAVDPIDARIMLAELRSRVHRGNDGLKDLEALAAEVPARPEPYVALGYAGLRDGRMDAAADLFAKAYERGARDTKMLYDYARLIRSQDAKRSAEIFSHLIAADTENVDYRVEHAWALLSAGESQKARITLAPLQKISPKDAPRVFRATAAAEVALQNYDEALKVSRRWLEYEKDDQGRMDAQTQIAGLERALEAKASGPHFMARSGPVEGVAAPRRMQDGPDQTADGHPRLQRREREEFKMEVVTMALSTVQGTFVRLDCMGDKANVVLSNHGGEAIFHIDDQKKVLIDGTSGLNIDLTCGKQPPMKVEVMYLPATDNSRGVVGVVRGLKRLQ